MGRKGVVSAERAAPPPPLPSLSSLPPPRARRGAAPPPARRGEPHVLGAARARGVAAALAWLGAAVQRLPGGGGGGGGGGARVRLPALRERALVGGLAGCAAGAFVNGALVRARARRPARALQRVHAQPRADTAPTKRCPRAAR
jgi:hypothetical protein